MNTIEAAAFTKIPIDILVRMRARETTSILGGPPVNKRMLNNGEVRYIYSKADLKRWKKMRNCRITAKDAAIILGTSRDELVTRYGIQSYLVKTKEYSGKLVIDNGKSIYIWIPK